MNKLLLSAAIVAAMSPTIATAQFLENVPGPYLSGTPPRGFGTQYFQYNCTNATPTSGNCAAVVYVMNANPNGQALANASAPVVLPVTQVSTDPCTLGGGVGGPVTKANFAYTTSAAVLQIVAPVALEQVYFCTIDINTTAADSISLIGGLGALCTTGTRLTIAGPMAWPALYTWSRGTGGATAYRTTTSGHGVCVTQTGTTALSISGTYVQQ
jgi:hypothetical protein